MFKKLLGNIRGNQTKINDISDDIRFNRIAENKQLSPQEQEFNRLMEEKRQHQLKETVKEIHKQKEREFRSNRGVIDSPNMFEAGKNELLHTPNMFRTNEVQSTKLFFKN